MVVIILWWLKILLITGLLTSCSLLNKLRLDVNQTPQQTTIIKADKPTPVYPVEVRFVVLTKETVDKLNAEVLEGKSEPYVFYGLNENDYLDIANWLKDIQRYINMQNNNVEYYENVIDKLNQDISEQKSKD